MIVREILSHQLKSQADLDRILARCCELVLDGQQTDPDHWGMVGACVILPNGEEVYGVNHRDSEGLHIHAERAALNACETADSRCMIVTTLSPCNRPMDNRHGQSCADLIATYDIGLENVYCGYKDPTQDLGPCEETNNPKLRELCKRLADTFLKDNQVNEISDERLQDYLSRANRQVDARMNRIARVRDRLNKGYEIYHAETPNKIVHNFEANTPAEAQRYYADYVNRYESDVDYDLRLRRATGIAENFADGKKPGRKGLAKRSGVNCKQSVSKLRSIAKNSSGEKQRMAHWCANMKAGKNESTLDEKWSEKYKRSIDCSNPKGFSQRAHCQGRKKK